MPIKMHRNPNHTVSQEWILSVEIIWNFSSGNHEEFGQMPSIFKGWLYCGYYSCRFSFPVLADDAQERSVCLPFSAAPEWWVTWLISGKCNQSVRPQHGTQHCIPACYAGLNRLLVSRKARFRNSGKNDVAIAQTKRDEWTYVFIHSMMMLGGLFPPLPELLSRSNK